VLVFRDISERKRSEAALAERVRLLAFWLAAGGAAVLVGRLGFFPWLRGFAESAHCRSILGIEGAAVLFHGLFVGVPMLGAGLASVLISRRGCKILRQGRAPPVGEKVFRPTPVLKGARARRSGWLQLVSPVPFLALAVWGGFQARSLTAAPIGVPKRCAADTALQAPLRARPSAS
jgi:hypothetical protein